MVERQLRRRGIADERVLAAMAEVPRELFVAERLGRRAYADSALPIGDQQTISQPWVVAAICQALELTGAERVLEIGTGSGYSTAILALLAAEVISIERFEGLAAEARERLAEPGGRVRPRSRSGSATAPSGLPTGRRSTRSRSTRPPRRRRRACSSSSAAAAASCCRSPSRARTC